MSSTVALAVAILGILGTVIGLLIKMSRRSPEQRSSDAQVWTSLTAVNTGLAGEVARLSGRVETLEQANADQRAEVAELSEKAEAGKRAEREVSWLRGLVVRAVRPLVEWIDAGAHPPPPRIHTDLRALLAEAEQHDLDDPTP